MKKLIVLFAFCVGAFLWVMPVSMAAAPVADETTPTPTPAAEVAATAVTTTAVVTEPTVTELLARLDALQAQVDELAAHHAAEHTAADATQVGTAVYLLDTAGLHDLDVQLNEEKVINPGDAGRVTRLVRLLSSVVWPEALATDAHGVLALLDQLATALTDDQVDAAAPLATQVHEAQHDFSHAVEHWLREADAPTPDAGQAFRVTSAVYLLDTAGLHDLDVRLNEEKVIDPADAGKVARVVRLLSTVDWPEPLATAAVTLTTVLRDLATALTDDNLEAAAPLATQVHEVQHAFSHAAEHWLGEQTGGHGEDEVEGADHHEDGDATESDDHAEDEGGDQDHQDEQKDSSGG